MEYENKTVHYSLQKDAESFEFCNKMFDASHVLIGGTTGSGKTTLIDDYIYSILGRFFPFGQTPNDVQFVLIDPKRVSLVKYKCLPHTIAYACETDEILQLLTDTIEVMDNRYRDMARRGLEMYDKGHIVIIIDELADLMTTCKKQIMPLLQRIAQLGRASRIKLVCATQCPNREVIPAVLTVNFDGRVGLRCNDRIESKQIVKRYGAETLPKYGKCIYLHNDGCYYNATIEKLPDAVLRERIMWWKNQTPSWWRPLENRVTTSKPRTITTETTNPFAYTPQKQVETPKKKRSNNPLDYDSFWQFLMR